MHAGTFFPHVVVLLSLLWLGPEPTVFAQDDGQGAEASNAQTQQESRPDRQTGGRRGGGPGRGAPVDLGPDDKAAFDPAPEGFDQSREDIPHGSVETVTYSSKTVGNDRQMVIYTPPGYSSENKYPVLYLLHGIGDDETGWHRKGSAEHILDSLKEHDVAHIWHVDSGGHSWPVWKNDLYLFAQQIFR